MRTVMHKIISYCWSNKIFPKTWKNAFTILIHKKGSNNNPSNFRPITLQPVLAKIYSSLIRNRIYQFLYSNNYIESKIQKGFWKGLSGTIEHTELLSYVINHARNKQRESVVTLLDLKNAFGEVDHELLKKDVEFHHIPEEIKTLVKNYYENYHISVGTESFITNPIPIKKGVLQGDCLSPILFNKVINTLIRSVDEERIRCIGYSFSSTLHPRHWFQFADDSAIVTSTEKDNQLLLGAIQKGRHRGREGGRYPNLVTNNDKGGREVA